MAEIKQHIPAYVTEYENETATFNSLEELLKIEFVDNFRKLQSGELNPDFHQFSLNKRWDNALVLIAEYKGGEKMWVVGYITNDETGITKNLPEWKNNKII